MNFKNVTAGLCAAVMALTMLPAMSIDVQAAEAPTGKVYAPHVDSSKFPHATGSPIDKTQLQNKCKTLTGKITFSKEAYPGAGGVALNSDSTVYVIKDPNGQDATIYSKEGGGVFAPVDSSRLFINFRANTLDLSNLDTSNVTNMGDMFGYTKVTNLDVSNFDTSKVTNMTLMFSGLKAANLDVSNFDTSKVTDMSGMFNGANGGATTSITGLSNFDTSNVTNMYSMFQSSKATSLDLSSFDTSKVTDMGMMFQGSKATNLDLSNFDTSKVTYTEDMFRYSAATSVLCRTSEDMNKMKTSERCTATGFCVKHNPNTHVVNTSYVWSQDNNSCTATRKCTTGGCLYEETATGNVVSSVNKEATCGAAGDTKYTATFAEPWASEQTKTVVGNIPATGKHVYDDEFDKNCNVCGQERKVDSTRGQEGANNVPVTLNTVAHTFSVTVPTSLPISVAADGTISCADAAACKVINNEEGPVDIKSVTLSGDNQWVIVPTSTAMESEAVNTKKLAMTVMGYDTNDGGLNTAAFQAQTINGNADFGIVYTAKLPTQTVETDKAPVANVVFTIGWHEAA